MTVDLLGAVFAWAVMLLIGYVAGSLRLSRYHDARMDWLEEIVRVHYYTTGHVYPPQPSPEPGWWQRQSSRNASQRPLTAPEWDEGPWPPPEAPEDADGALRATGDGIAVIPTPEGDSRKVTDEPEPERNEPTQPFRRPSPGPGPATQPDMKQAAAVAPPAVDYEQWKREADARFARDMAAIRGAK